MEGITYIEHFIKDPATLWKELNDTVAWDGSMAARKTASYGVAYNYSQMQYPFREMLPALVPVIKDLEHVLGFEANNCLINYYPDGQSKMGFHADQTDILDTRTGIAIVSLGETRTLRFRKTNDKAIVQDYLLPAGSLVYMTQEVQRHWQHAIPASATALERISLTFRRISS